MRYFGRATETCCFPGTGSGKRRASRSSVPTGTSDASRWRLPRGPSSSTDCQYAGHRQSNSLFERRDGNFRLQITGHPQFGLPFGQDKLVLIFLATLAIRQKSPVVRFRSAAEMLDTFGMSKGGKEYRRIVAAFERIFGATMFVSTESTRLIATVIHLSRSGTVPHGQNTITLSDEFFAEISGHPVPVDIEAIKVLAALSLLDLFMWLSYRCVVAKEPESIPLVGPFELTQQLGCVEYSRPSRFRAMPEQWLQTIPSLWPKCPAIVSGYGRILLIDRRAEVQVRFSCHLLAVPEHYGSFCRFPGAMPECPCRLPFTAADGPADHTRHGEIPRHQDYMPERALPAGLPSRSMNRCWRRFS